MEKINADEVRYAILTLNGNTKPNTVLFTNWKIESGSVNKNLYFYEVTMRKNKMIINSHVKSDALFNGTIISIAKLTASDKKGNIMIDECDYEYDPGELNCDGEGEGYKYRDYVKYMEYYNTNTEPLSFKEWLVNHEENVNEADFEIYKLQGIGGLKTTSVIHSDCRIDPSTVSDELHIYDMREDEDPTSAKWRIAENNKNSKGIFKGTIISISELPLRFVIDNYDWGGTCTYEEYIEYMKYVNSVKSKPVSFFEYAGKSLI